MTAHHTLADRLRARARQLDIPPAHLAEKAGVNRSFVYDILRGRSAHPSREKLATLADLLNVDLDWLLHGIGEVEGVSPFIENPDETFVAIAHAGARPSMGGGAVVEEEHIQGRNYHFRLSWIRQGLGASHRSCGSCMSRATACIPRCRTATRCSSIFSRRSPVPPGIFVLHDGIGLVAKRLEHIPNSDPPAMRVISDNPIYGPYERTADEIHIVGRIRWFAREI